MTRKKKKKNKVVKYLYIIGTYNNTFKKKKKHPTMIFLKRRPKPKSLKRKRRSPRKKFLKSVQVTMKVLEWIKVMFQVKKKILGYINRICINWILITEGELETLDTSLIIPGGRRTRGKKIDYKQFGADPEDDDE
jgi:hypothetical protein